MRLLILVLTLGVCLPAIVSAEELTDSQQQQNGVVETAEPRETEPRKAYRKRNDSNAEVRRSSRYDSPRYKNRKGTQSVSSDGSSEVESGETSQQRRGRRAWRENGQGRGRRAQNAGRRGNGGSAENAPRYMRRDGADSSRSRKAYPNSKRKIPEESVNPPTEDVNLEQGDIPQTNDVENTPEE